MVTWNGQQYFIIFIDDFFIYDYVYLVSEKLQLLNVFKSYKAEVENQLNKRLKSIRSNRYGEYYGRYDDLRELCLGLFAKFLYEYGFVPQYTTLGSPNMNSVVER